MTAAPGTVTGDAALQAAILTEMAVAARNYQRWLTDLASPHLGDDPLEIGSGTGDYAAAWAAAGQPVTVSEGYGPLLETLRDRFDAEPLVTVRELLVPIDADADHSAVVAFNVLEHIPDDVAALRSFRRLLRTGGSLVLFVPAFPLLMSDYDRAIGHQRRYRRRTLAETITAGGYRVESMRHVNLVGFVAWLVGMRLLRSKPGDTAAVRLFDTAVVPVMRRLESVLPPPFGQSLFAIAHPDDTA
jgi:SAM-dependent methyltransferase